MSADQSQAPTADHAIQTVPASWPGAFGAYKFSKAAVRLNLGTLLLLELINFAASVLLSLIHSQLLVVLSYLVSAFFSVALVELYITSVRQEQLDVDRLLREVWQNPVLVLKYLGLEILTFTAVLLGFLLLIVPGIIVLARLSLGAYFLVDKDSGVTEALQASWDATKGNVGKVWGIIGASFAMVLLFFTIIGIPFAIYFLIMYSGAIAVLYEYLHTHPSTAPPAVDTSPSSTP